MQSSPVCKMKMDVRLLGLSIVIFAFAIVETSAQSFYPTRYGKREGRGADDRGPQYERRSDASGNLFFGSRYGKRSYNMTPSELSNEKSPASAGHRYERSPDAISTERFFFGSRFGKRSQRQASHNQGTSHLPAPEGEVSEDEYLVCRYTGFRHLYHCLSQVDNDQTGEKVL